jgi:cobalt-zinc-cadmium efflux system membrane fusion protein
MYMRATKTFTAPFVLLMTAAVSALLILSCGPSSTNIPEVDAHQEADDGHNHEGEETQQHEGEEAAAPDLIAASEEWKRLIGLETTPVRRMTINDVLTAPAKVIPNENRVATVSPFIESSINYVLVNIGDKVEKGDVLVCLISPEIGVLRAEHEKALAELAIAEQKVERQYNLFQREIVPEKSLQEAQLEKQLAEASLKFALKRMSALGIEPQEIDHTTGHTDSTGSTVHVLAPISGTITYRNAAVGQKVDQSTKLFEIMNLENVWLDIDIFEKDLASVKRGQEVSLKVPAYRDSFSGRLFYIGDTVAEDTKTLCLKAKIENRDGRLKPGMFADASVVIGKRENALVVPKEAILDDGQERVVFVVEGEGYHRHSVTTGLESEGLVEILAGVSPDATVVISGHYQLLTKADDKAIDPHAGHVH